MSDDENFILSEAKIAIVGLGLMGGSLALALRNKCAAIFGIDPDLETLEIALSQNIVDKADTNPAKLLPLADLVVLAAPVPAILAILDKLDELVPNPCVVFDLGSTKEEIVEKMRKLPSRFEPIGGHPICGKERLSINNADRTLYYSAKFFFTPLPTTTDRARSAATQVASAIGAYSEFVSPSEHDRILASTSHLPFLLSSALAMATPSNTAPFIGPGFRSTSRLAGTPESMMLGVIMSNRMNILAALEKFQDELAMFTSAIADNDNDSLQASLMAARESYQQLIG